jgi:hypothetical protein
MADASVSHMLLEGVDRISNLPDEILGHILYFLPSKDAITTTILSHRWENLWAKFLPLRFDECLFSIYWRFSDDRLHDDHLQENVLENQEIILPYFMKFVDKALSLRENDVSIKKFELDLTHCHELSVISKWIQWAISRNVQNLIISTYHYNNPAPYFPPLRVLECKQLNKLKLSGYFLIDLQNSEICLPNLKSIDFRNVTFGDELQISNMLSSSPLLEEIEICNLIITRGPKESRSVCICAPRLKRLEIRSRYHMAFVNYNYRVHAPFLKHLGFTFNQFNNIVVDSSPSKITEVEVYMDVKVPIKMQQLTDVLSHAEEFGLYFLEFHLVSPPAIKLPMLRNLKTLSTLIDPHCQQYFIHVLESAPNLKYMFLHLCGDKFGIYRNTMYPSHETYRLCWGPP